MAQIAGMVLRARDRHLTAKFYADLGLHENEHRHGGPTHHELGPVAGTAVVEVYQASADFSSDALMIEVDSIDIALGVASLHGVIPEGDTKEAGDMRFVYIRDPDGRPLMLIERT